MSVWAAIILAGGLWVGCGSTGPDVTPPDVPQGFSRVGGGDGENKFAWQRNREKDLAGYRLYRTQDDPASTYTRIATIPPESTSYTDSGLDYTIMFYYKLTAFDQTGNESEATTPILSIAANLTPPAPPANVHAVAQNLVPPASITLSWSPNTEGDFQEYQIYRSSSPNVVTTGTPFKVIPKGTTAYEDTSVAVGTKYYYRVVAADKGGLKSPGSLSTEVSAIPLPPVTLTSPVDNATVTSLTPEFRWSPVSQASGYKVFVYKDVARLSQQWSQSVQSPTTTIVYSGQALTSGRTYYWCVATITGDDEQMNSVSALWKFTTP